jgi:hypothetical protein
MQASHENIAAEENEIMKHIDHGSKWGNWTLDARLLALNLQVQGHSYQIELEDITDSTKMLDWIFQIRIKTWATNDIVGDLISAFQDIFHPQSSLCGQGIPKTIDTTDFLRKRLGK